MITFQNAVDVAKENASQLLSKSANYNLESVLISEDNKLIEVTLSYDVQGGVGLDLLKSNKKNNSNMSNLATLLGIRREFKVFLVDAKTGIFRGFKNYKP